MGAFNVAQTHDLHITSQTCNPLRRVAPIMMLIQYKRIGLCLVFQSSSIVWCSSSLYVHLHLYIVCSMNEFKLIKQVKFWQVTSIVWSLLFTMTSLYTVIQGPHHASCTGGVSTTDQLPGEMPNRWHSTQASIWPYTL